MVRFARAAVLALLSIAFVGACGGDDDKTATATTATTADTTDVEDDTSGDDGGANAGVVDGYCTIKAELDARDEADPQRLDDLLATTPDEIADEGDAYVERRRAGDFYASEELDAYFDTHCS